MSDPSIVLIRLGEPVATTRARVGDYSLWFQRALPVPLGVVDLRREDEELPDAAGYLVMGSPLAVYDPHPWLPRALEVARAIMEGPRPALGVCFGHQLFAAAQGGEVRFNPRGVEVGTIDVTLTEAARGDPLLVGLEGRTLRVNASHDDTVVRLPGERPPAVLGTSPRDAHQILRWGPLAWSVQFHPEMRRGETRLAVSWRAPRLRNEGLDPEAVEAAVDDGPDGQTILANFLEIVRQA